MLGDVIRDLGSLLKGLQVSCWDGVWDLSNPQAANPHHSLNTSCSTWPL